MSKQESFYIGLGIDSGHVDNIYRCVGMSDFQFLIDKLKRDKEQLKVYLDKVENENEQAKLKLQLEWLEKLKFWKIPTKINFIPFDGGQKND